MIQQVTTVCGPVDAQALGVTSMHEHLLLDLRRITGVPDAILEDADLAAAEISHFKRAGGNTIVELTSYGLGRRPTDLLAIAQRTGLNIVMGCGWYREPFYETRVFRTSTQELADEMVREIQDGVDGTGIRPGIIGEVGTHGDHVTPAEERGLRAAARAQLATDLSISTHAPAARVGAAQLQIFLEEGVDPYRVIIGHLDRSRPWDLQYLQMLVSEGAWIEFDLIREPSDWELTSRVEMIRAVAEFGGLHRLVLGQDVCTKRHLKNYGGGGYDRLLVAFRDKLVEAGFTVEEIDTLLVVNPRKALTGAS